MAQFWTTLFWLTKRLFRQSNLRAQSTELMIFSIQTEQALEGLVAGLQDSMVILGLPELFQLTYRLAEILHQFHVKHLLMTETRSTIGYQPCVEPLGRSCVSDCGLHSLTVEYTERDI